VTSIEDSTNTFTTEGAAPVALSVSLRDQIKQVQDIPSEIMDVPEWKVKVEIRGMDGDETLSFMEQASGDGKEAASFAALYPQMITRSVFDPATGERLFTEEDWDWLRGKSGAALNRLATKAMALSGLTEAAAEEAGKDS
jgi:hypothetical protein